MGGGGGLGGRGRVGGVRVDVNEELKFFFLGGKGGGWVGEGGQGGCESRIEVFWKIQKKKNWGGGGRVGPWGGGGGPGWGVRMDVNDELKFL